MQRMVLDAVLEIFVGNILDRALHRHLAWFVRAARYRDSRCRGAT